MSIQLRLPELQIPHLYNGRFILRTVVLTQAVAIVLTFAPGMHSDPWYRLGLISLFVHWVMLVTTLALSLLRDRLNRLPPLAILAACTVIFLAITVLLGGIAFNWLQVQQVPLQQSFSAFMLANIMIALIIAVIAIQFFIMHAERNQQVRAQSQAELSALQARIEPHFLFNSLNTVAELTQIDPNAAEQALINLSALFRAALNAGNIVSLADELKLSQQYLSLEQWRLSDRMNIVWDIPAQIPDVLLPALTIQPLLENAVRYGVEPSADVAELKIVLIESRMAVSIVITNPICTQGVSNGGNGIALSNIRQRLQLHFGGLAQLHTAANGPLYRIKLVLPKRVH